MLQKLTHLTLAVVALVLIAGPSALAFGPGQEPSLFGWWKFDEEAGTIAQDASGNGFDGTLTGGPVWVTGTLTGALQFDGVDDYVEVAHDEGLTVDTEVTVMAWINAERYTGPDNAAWQGILSKGGSTRSYSFYTYTDGSLHFSTGGAGGNSDPVVPLNEWVHVCAMVRTGTHAYYVNGDAAGANQSGITLPGTNDVETVVIGRTNEGDTRSFLGMIDDVRLYNRALTQEEVQIAMGGEPILNATKPSPADAQDDVRRDVIMVWLAGATATTHDIYLGTTFEDVDAASRTNPMDVLVSQGQAEAAYDPEGLLVIGQTYYWRVDEVDADQTITRGEVWSFTAEPYTYAIENIVVTSSVPSLENQGPENLVNGSGLNENDQHSTTTEDMWVGEPEEGQIPQLLFEFDRVYKLHEMLIWNYNLNFEMWLGFSVKEATVEYSENGVDWTSLGDIVLNQGPGASSYTYDTIVSFEGAAVQYVRLTIGSSYMSTEKHGLSEVRFNYIPVTSKEPKPANEATNVALGTTLAWRPGREAASHEIYLGTDPDTMTLAGTSTGPAFTPASLGLETTYYWQIVDVNNAEAISSWAGSVWTFSTQEYIEIDGFESYDDDFDAETTIWQAWVDGFEDGSNGGSMVGNDPSPFAELTIVHSGSQSLPLFYENTSASGISEADFTIAPAQDWTDNGVKTLSLWFYGDPDNAGQLYVKINNTQIAYDGEAADIAIAQWQPWNIDLSTTGANLSNVSTLSIGIEGTGSGVIYIDDVRLYGRVQAPTVPVEPGSDNLILHYTLDEGSGAVANDTSGNGNDGTIIGNPNWISGVVGGGALNFVGLSDYIATNKALLSNLQAFTISCWLKGDFSAASRMGLIGQNDCVEYGFDSANSIQLYTSGGGSATGAWPYDASEWHSVTSVGNGETITIYVDGKTLVTGGGTTESYGSSSFTVNIAGGGVFDTEATNGNWYAGSIDDCRIYQRALSPAEVGGLAGRTAPIHEGM